MAKSSSSANATPRMAYVTFHWHQKKQLIRRYPYLPPRLFNTRPMASSKTSTQSKILPLSTMEAPTAQYLLRSFGPSDAATSTPGRASLLTLSPNTSPSPSPPAKAIYGCNRRTYSPPKSPPASHLPLHLMSALHKSRTTCAPTSFLPPSCPSLIYANRTQTRQASSPFNPPVVTITSWSSTILTATQSSQGPPRRNRPAISRTGPNSTNTSDRMATHPACTSWTTIARTSSKKHSKNTTLLSNTYPAHPSPKRSGTRHPNVEKPFYAGLATCDPKFPLLEWDLLMPQAELTLNLLRASRRQPKLSAYACLNGPFDFNKTPLAPPGTRVIVHITPDQRSNMAPHGVDGWYVGPSPKHYRCHKCHLPSTHRTRDALTVDWFPHHVPFPKVTNDEYLRQTATDMLTVERNLFVGSPHCCFVTIA
jgi:hypothetical protein